MYGPREKLRVNPIESLSEADLVALLISSGGGGRSYKEISLDIQKALLKFKDLLSLKEDLMNISGVGDVLASRVISGIELGRRFADKDSFELKNPKLAYRYFLDIAHLKREVVKVLALDVNNRIIGQEVIFSGGVNRVNFYVSDLFRYLFYKQSVKFIIGHNHPSGDTSPSEADKIVTERIVKSSNLLDINFLDHIIINAKEEWDSVFRYL